VKTLTDISHFDLFRILDILKLTCEMENSEEPIDAIKYVDIYNLAAASMKLRISIRNWSKEMYRRLEIDLLQVIEHKKLTVNFNEIHKSIKQSTKERKKQYMDTYIKAIMRNPSLSSIKLLYKPQEYVRDHDDVFNSILKAIRGEEARKEYHILNPKIFTQLMELPIKTLSNLNGLRHFRNISKLSVKASFEMADLVEFCRNNPALESLEINVFRFTDYGKLAEIVPHCPKLKELKFILNDNARDTDYIHLANLNQLQHLEIVKSYSEEFDLTAKQPRRDALLDSNFYLIKLFEALSQNEKSSLRRLTLKFEVEDIVVQWITKIKSLRILECGFYDPESIQHLKNQAELCELNISSSGLFISDGIVNVLQKGVIVSYRGAKLALSSRGQLMIFANKEAQYPFVKFELLLNIENLRTINFTQSIDQLTLGRFLERGVKI
ncbi:hypothetical protein KR018_011244, partial [Drosophila ironensis]